THTDTETHRHRHTHTHTHQHTHKTHTHTHTHTHRHTNTHTHIHTQPHTHTRQRKELARVYKLIRPHPCPKKIQCRPTITHTRESLATWCASTSCEQLQSAQCGNEGWRCTDESFSEKGGGGSPGVFTRLHQ